MLSVFKKERPNLREGKSAKDNSGADRSRRSGRGFLERSTKLLDRIVFACLLGLIVTTSIPYGTVEPWWESIFECAVFAVTAIWIFKVLVRGSWDFRGLFILLPLIIITAYAFAQTVEWPAWLAIGSGRLTAQHTLTIDRYQTYLTARKAL